MKISLNEMKEKYAIPKEFHDKKIIEGFYKGDPNFIKREEEISNMIKKYLEDKAYMYSQKMGISEKNNGQFNYDAKYDILYISKEPNESSIGTEEVDGVIVRRSIKDNKFVGVTIFNIKKIIGD